MNLNNYTFYRKPKFLQKVLLIGPKYYSLETKRHQAIIRASKLNTAILSNDSEETR